MGGSGHGETGAALRKRRGPIARGVTRFGTLWLKVALSAGALGLILSRLDPQQLVSVLGRVVGWQSALFFLAMGGVSLLGAWKWQLLLKSWAIELPYLSLARWVLVGMFFNNVLPGGIGGDASRLYSSARASGSVAQSLVVLFWDRLYALGALVALGIAALVAMGDFANNAVLWLILVGTGLAILAMLALVGLPWCQQLVVRVVSRPKPALAQRLSNWLESLRPKPGRGRSLWRALAVAVAMQVVALFAHYSVMVSLQIQVSLLDIFVFVPILYLAVAIPISVNGIGIREVTSVMFFTRLGVPQAEAVGYSLVYFVFVLLFSLLGAVVYLLDRG